jgi:hypothetical protein
VDRQLRGSRAAAQCYPAWTDRQRGAPPRVDHERGSIRTGLAADLVAVLDNPLADIQTLKRVMFVMKNGRVIRNDTARATS